MPPLHPNRYRGKLIVVEGIDGSGKSTQLSLLSQWLRSQCLAVAFSEWNSSPLVRETTKRGKKKNMFTPVTFSLIHATDFADRLERYIVPLVKSGAIVCADRYAYTAFARDVVRGVSRRWVRNLYRYALRPNLAFYFRVPLEVAIGRILGGRNAIKFYEAGMDLGLSRNVEESFRIFQGRILDEYEAMIQEVGFHVIDATGSIEEQQQQMREIVMRELGESLLDRSGRYVRLTEAFVYLAVILDAFSRRVIGWALETHMLASLVIAALKMALAARRPLPGTLVHHSDRGTQYACSEYTDILNEHAILPSMSRVAYPYDNAKAESFMKTLKQEEVNASGYRDVHQARQQIGIFLDDVYNRQRLHSALDYRSPVEFEAQMQHRIPGIIAVAKEGFQGRGKSTAMTELNDVHP